MEELQGIPANFLMIHRCLKWNLNAGDESSWVLRTATQVRCHSCFISQFGYQDSFQISIKLEIMKSWYSTRLEGFSTFKIQVTRERWARHTQPGRWFRMFYYFKPYLGKGSNLTNIFNWIETTNWQQNCSLWVEDGIHHRLELLAGHEALGRECQDCHSLRDYWGTPWESKITFQGMRTHTPPWKRNTRLPPRFGEVLVPRVHLWFNPEASHFMVLFVLAPLKNSVDWYRSHWLNEQPYEAHLVDVATKVRMVRSVFFWKLESEGMATYQPFFQIQLKQNEVELVDILPYILFCFVTSRHVSALFLMCLPSAPVGAILNRCPAMLSDSSLRQQRGLVEKTPQVSENAMLQPCRKWCRSEKKTKPTILPTLKVNPKDYISFCC